ncbi:MAG: hypothetical protein U0798_07705 [Gemmataceae bacterium]
MALPLTTIGTLTIANAYYLQQNGYAEGNKPGPGPLTTPEWKTRFHNNIESDPLFKPLLDKTATHHPPTLEDKLYVYRLLYNYRHGIYVNYTQQVTANDPNEIVGPAGFGASGFVQPTGAFPYTIHFENQSSASAPAQVVTVTQQLDSDIDWQSFSLNRSAGVHYRSTCLPGCRVITRGFPTRPGTPSSM